MRRHLEQCAECNNALVRLAGTADRPVGEASELLARIESQMHDWTPLAVGPSVRRRVIREIAPYLGTRASARLLSGVEQDGANLLSTVEPMLALFLGSRAASRLVDHMVDTVLMRN